MGCLGERGCAVDWWAGGRLGGLGIRYTRRTGSLESLRISLLSSSVSMRLESSSSRRSTWFASIIVEKTGKPDLRLSEESKLVVSAEWKRSGGGVGWRGRAGGVGLVVAVVGR